MLSIDLKIKSISNKDALERACFGYTKVFHKLHANPHLLDDELKLSELRSVADLDKTIFDFCVMDVETSLKQTATFKKNKEDRITLIETRLAVADAFNTKAERLEQYKLTNKLSFLKRTKDNGRTFGGKSLQREITQLAQWKQKANAGVKDNNGNLITFTERDEQRLNEKRELFKENRTMPIYLVGRACEGGNRKANFDLDNNKITLKLSRDNWVEIEFYIKDKNSRKRRALLAKLQDMLEHDEIALTLRVDTTHIVISYDEALVHGYHFKETEMKRQLKSCGDDIELKRKVRDSFVVEHKERMLAGKIGNRHCGVDLNPKHIAFTIVDYEGESSKIIYAASIDLTGLEDSSELPTDDPESIHINNKRKHEIVMIWKFIFAKMKHYKVSTFHVEELSFKIDSKCKGKYFNSLTHNLWHRQLTREQITKRCNENGIVLNMVSPWLTSFIGNMIYPYFDPVSAALAVCERGVNSGKDKYYTPDLTRINREKLVYLLGENGSGLVSRLTTGKTTWGELYLETREKRYRNEYRKDSFIAKNLYCLQSKILVHELKCF